MGANLVEFYVISLIITDFEVKSSIINMSKIEMIEMKFFIIPRQEKLIIETKHINFPKNEKNVN